MNGHITALLCFSSTEMKSLIWMAFLLNGEFTLEPTLDSRVSCKSWGIRDENHKKCVKMLGRLHLLDKT